MRTHLGFALLTVATLLSRADAQTRPSTPAAATPTPAVDLPTPSNRNVSITPVFLSRDAVKRSTDKMTSANKTKRPGILGSLEKTVQGDKNAIEVAKNVLGSNAQTLAKEGATVIVIVGGTAELTKVLESLSHVERPIRVAYVDRAFEDASYDNTVLNSGMIGAVKDAADNMWVYLPRRGSARSKPDRVLSTKAATATLWNGLFAADGDAVDVKQLKSLVASDSAASRPENQAATSSDGVAGGALAVGDVIAPKIANVKVLAEAKVDSKVLGTVAKSDELVVTGAPKNGFVMVEGAAVKGWVSLTLVAKK